MDMTLNEYIGYWMETFKSKSVKSSTYDRLITSSQALKKYPISDMNIGDITATEIQEYVNSLTDKYTYTGIKKMMRIVTAPLAKAAALHHIPSNPGVGIELPSREHVKKKSKNNSAYSAYEQERLSVVLKQNKWAACNVILFMMATGLRVGEAICLEWKDVDLKRKAVRIHKTVENLANKKQHRVREGAKTYTSNRVLPLTDEAMKVLLDCKKNGGRWIFQNGKDGDMISYEAVRYQTKKICEEAGVEYKGEHVFRHTFATNSFNENIDIKFLSKYLGHASTAITYDTYIDLYGDGFDDLRSAFCK